MQDLIKYQKFKEDFPYLCKQLEEDIHFLNKLNYTCNKVIIDNDLNMKYKDLGLVLYSFYPQKITYLRNDIDINLQKDIQKFTLLTSFLGQGTSSLDFEDKDSIINFNHISVNLFLRICFETFGFSCNSEENEIEFFEKLKNNYYIEEEKKFIHNKLDNTSIKNSETKVFKV